MTCTRAGCKNIQCYVCSKSCDYSHFNDLARGGKEGNCPLFDKDGVEARHDNEVQAAEVKARLKVMGDNPRISEELLKFDTPKSTKKKHPAQTEPLRNDAHPNGDGIWRPGVYRAGGLADHGLDLPHQNAQRAAAPLAAAVIAQPANPNVLRVVAPQKFRQGGLESRAADQNFVPPERPFPVQLPIPKPVKDRSRPQVQPHVPIPQPYNKPRDQNGLQAYPPVPMVAKSPRPRHSNQPNVLNYIQPGLDWQRNLAPEEKALLNQPRLFNAAFDFYAHAANRVGALYAEDTQAKLAKLAGEKELPTSQGELLSLGEGVPHTLAQLDARQQARQHPQRQPANAGDQEVRNQHWRLAQTVPKLGNGGDPAQWCNKVEAMAKAANAMDFQQEAQQAIQHEAALAGPSRQHNGFYRNPIATPNWPYPPSPAEAGSMSQHTAYVGFLAGQGGEEARSGRTRDDPLELE